MRETGEKKAQMLTDTSSSPYARLNGVPIGAVHWTRGFWHEHFKRCHAVMVPNMWQIWQDAQISHGYANFLIAAGEQEGSHSGPQWHDGDFYKWLEGVAAVYAVTKDEALNCLMDKIIELIGRVQRADGYIHTPVLIKQRQRKAEASEFGERLDFETYNIGHLLTTACLHYRATGKESLLAIAQKAADYLYRFYIESAPELARNAICPSHYMGVIELYRTTHDPRYLELGKNLVEIRDLVTGGGDDNQDRLPFRQQTTAAGHAVRANYLYAGVADVYAETGDSSLLETLETLWENVVYEKMYITGGCGALYDGASPDGSPDQATITRVHQSYGREYQLPNVTAYNETCANIGNALWNWRMLNITQEARFADILELVLYNSALSSIGLDGKSFFYTNPLRQVNDLPFELRWSCQREPYISCFCCPPNILRLIAEVGGYAYSLSEEGVWVNLYGSNTLECTLANGSPFTMVQETDYPWDGRVRFELKEPPAGECGIMLRIPGWAREVSVRINGELAATKPQPGQYFKLKRAWAAGDKIELDIPMPVRLLEAHPLVEENRNEVAVMRGPLVYCLESVDLPQGVRPSEVLIPRDLELKPCSNKMPGELMAEIVVLEGRARLLPEQRERLHPLKRELRVAPLGEVEIKMIPYYAWANRGKSEMTVWLPLVW
jgi:DUF1680 family protein